MTVRGLLGILAIAALGASACTAADAEVSPERSAGTTSTTSEATVTTPAPTPTVVTTTMAPPPAAPGPAAPADTPEAMATRIVAAERTARDPQAEPGDVAAAAFEAQLLYRQLARTPDWHGAVFAAVDELRPTVEANVAARSEFRGMHSTLSDTLPAWRIVEPAPADELLAHYQEGQATFGVPWQILAAVNLVETGMGRIRGTSVAGAQGPMQFMPGTWDAYGEGDINDPHDAILSAARYLAANGGGRGDIDNALFRYNNSNRYVRGVKHYASIMEADPQAFHLFYNWQVVYLSTLGDIWLPVGYEATDRVPVADYVTANPAHHLGTTTS